MLVYVACVLSLLACPALINGEPDYLKYFIKTIGSLDPNTSAITYLNGTVFGKQPGNPLQLLFLFEGYNINRKLAKPDGTYLSLSREFVVYRDPKTTEILRVWANPWTSKPNEVFWVANDPVDATLDQSVATSNLKVLNDILGFNTDVVLEYPNPLTPANYSKYSAGATYDAAELFTFFANLTDLESASMSVPMTATWVRKSEYLPWMEMGTSEGGLYYTTMSWKCIEGLSCIADDIMQLVKEYHPEYQTAPSVEVDPNETSWTVFKKTIDKRRQAGMPDIIIPQVNTTTNATVKVNSLDERVYTLLWNASFLHVQMSGQAYSEIYGKQPYHLFNFNGFMGVDFEPRPRRDGYRIQLDGSIMFRDTNGTLLKFWHNPITGKDCLVPKSFKIGVDLVFKNEHFFTIDMPSARSVGLVGAQSTDDGFMPPSPGNHSVNFVDLIFGYDELAKVATKPTSAKFYGTIATFSNWLSWMDMDEVPGNLVTKAIVYN